ncbi:VOC family protein [Kribbella alba]|uniref:VOC family protein n=1 Tax=Kribbella alba TaxID=190197 RepID=A0ABN2FAH7_9ACTN
MTSSVRTVTFDTHDPYTLATFWAEVLGGKLADDDFPGDPAATVTTDSMTLLFWQNPDTKSVKNRVHLDLEPDGSRDEEVERLLNLGAIVYDDRTTPDKLEPGAPLGAGFVVMLDPEGNEFCVLRSAAERAATS